MDFEMAEEITSAFLHNLRELRRRPTGDESLNEWRLSLWKEALGPSFSHLAGAFTAVPKIFTIDVRAYLLFFLFDLKPTFNAKYSNIEFGLISVLR